MGLIAVMTGIGVGMMRKRDSNLTTEINGRLLRSILRQARNSAKVSGTGVVVRLDAEDSLVAASPIILGGCWHFEDERGARNTKIDSAVELVEEGWMGRAAKLSGSSVDLGSYSWYVATQGFRVQLWIKAEQANGGVIFLRQNSFKLTLTQEGALNGEVIVGKQNETVATKTRDGLIAVGKWHEVALSYDRLELIVEVDGVRFAVKPEQRRMFVDQKSHLILGGSGFKGLADEMRYDVALDGKVEEFSTGVDVLKEGDLLVRFDGNGRLDRRFHTKPAVIILQGDPPDDQSDPIQERVRIEFTGAIR